MALSLSLPTLLIVPNVNSIITERDRGDQCKLKATLQDVDFGPATKKLKQTNKEVEMVLRQITEIVMVLVGVATLRSGAQPNQLECQLAKKAYEKLTMLVAILTPQNLVPKDVLQSLIQQLTVSPWHPTLPIHTNPVNIQSQCSSILSTISRSCPSSILSPTTNVSKPSTQTPTLSPSLSPLPSPPLLLPSLVAPFSLSTTLEPLVSTNSSPQTCEMLATTFKGTTHLVDVAQTSKSTTISIVVSPTSSKILLKTKALEEVQTSSSLTRENSVAPSMAPSFARALHTNTIVATSITPTNIPKIEFEVRTSSERRQALPTIDTQATTSMNSILIKDQRRSQTPKVLAKESQLKFFAEYEPPLGILDSLQTHKQLALVVHLLLKPHITIPSLGKGSLNYMNIPIPCVICKVVVNTTMNILVCDGCECVFHLQCLQLNSSYNISKCDWYCPKCVTTNVGRLQAPKYGPLRRGPIETLGPKSSWSIQD